MEILGNKSSRYFIVWNYEKTEGFITTDKQLAYEARKGAEDNCYYENGNPSNVAKNFTEVWGDKDCSVEVVETNNEPFRFIHISELNNAN